MMAARQTYTVPGGSLTIVIAMEADLSRIRHAEIYQAHDPDERLLLASPGVQAIRIDHTFRNGCHLSGTLACARAGSGSGQVPVFADLRAGSPAGYQQIHGINMSFDNGADVL